MRRWISICLVSIGLLPVALSALPAAGETIIEEKYKTESYRSGAAALPTPPPAVQERVIEQHKTETTIEQRAVPPPPPATIEKKTYEETVETK